MKTIIVFTTFLILINSLLFGQLYCPPEPHIVHGFQNVYDIVATNFPGNDYQWSVSWSNTNVASGVYIPTGSMPVITCEVVPNASTCQMGGSFQGTMMTGMEFATPNGPSNACGPGIQMYTTSYFFASGTLGSIALWHGWDIDGGTIIAENTGGGGLANFPTYDTVWVAWGAGTQGIVRSWMYADAYPFVYNCSTVDSMVVNVDCGVTAPLQGCIEDSISFKLGCSLASNIIWSSNSGTVVSGQGTDSIQMVWISSGNDTVMAIVDTSGCGIDTIVWPITINGLPLNQIVTDSIACAGTRDTISANVTPGSAYLWKLSNNAVQSASSGFPFLTNHGLSGYDTISLRCTRLGCLSFDTVIVRVDPLPNPNIGLQQMFCIGDSGVLDAGAGFSSYLWSNGSNSQAIIIDSSQNHTVIVSNVFGCVNSDSIQIFPDTTCVWPGDANSDNIVDLDDFLAVGVAFGSNGGIRPGASSVWQGHVAPDWSTTFLSGVNYKHADCNGDGTVNFADTNYVVLNQGLTHIRTGNVTAGDKLSFVPMQQRFSGWDTVTVAVHLGDSNHVGYNHYGLRFEINFNAAEIVPHSMTFHPSNSYLGNPGINMMTRKLNYSSSGAYWVAMVRFDQQFTQGYGELGKLKFLVHRQVWDGLNHATVNLASNSCRLIDSNGEDLLINCSDKEIVIYDPNAVGLSGESIAQNVKVAPNPATAFVQIIVSNLQEDKLELKISDALGRNMGFFAIEEGKHRISTQDYASGIYFFEFRDSESVFVRKVQIQH